MYLAGWWMLGDCAGQNNCGGADLDASGDVGLGDLALLAEQWIE